MEKIETVLYGMRALVPAMYLKDLKAKEAAVYALENETDRETRLKLNRKIIRLNRKIPGCVEFIRD